jgi:hypothetical protein
VSNRRTASHALNERGSAVFRWRIRVRSEQPHPIDDAEIIYRRLFSSVLNRASVTIARTSYMVGQPNREVLWGVDIWDEREHRWDVIVEGKSRLKANAGPS